MYLQNFYLEFNNGDHDLTFKEFFVNTLFCSKRAALGASMMLIWDKSVNQFTCDIDNELIKLPRIVNFSKFKSQLTYKNGSRSFIIKLIQDTH